MFQVNNYAVHSAFKLRKVYKTNNAKF